MIQFMPVSRGSGNIPVFDVTIPITWRGETAKAINFRGRSPDWGTLRKEYRKGTCIKVPDHIAHWKVAVRDELAFFWNGNELRCLHGRGGGREPRKGCIYLAAESPHKDEYCACGQPLGPLRNPETRRRVYNELPRLIKEAQKRLRIEFDDVDVVLGNPIQFQTSLHSLREDSGARLSKGIRDCVWKNLFDEQSIQDDFKRRIQDYSPALLLLAPTEGVREKLKSFNPGLPPERIMWVHKHPCVWSRQTTLALEEIKAPHG